MESLESLEKSTVERYSNRYKELGYHIRTLGWGSEAQQAYRFEQVIKALNPKGKTLLDIGCGFGDLLRFCEEQSVAPASYRGWDINPDLLFEGARRHPGGIFEQVNLAKRTAGEPVAAIGVMLGVLNFHFHDHYDNLTFSKKMIAKAFEAVSEGVAIDFISTHRTPEYPPEDFIFYHDPAAMLDYALTLTPRVILHHNYAPIPQREFMLFLYKEKA